VIQLLLGPLIGLVLDLIDTIVGLVVEYASFAAITAGGVYVADRAGLIDVSAILSSLINQYLDPSALLGVVL